MPRKEKLTPDESLAAKKLKKIWDSNKSRLGLTQTGMGERYKNRKGGSITQGAVGHFLSGRTALNARACALFADALQVPVEDFAPMAVIRELEKLQGRNTPKDYVEVTYHKRRFSAGAGASDGDEEDRVMYQKKWLDKNGVSSRDLKLVDVVGDSMSPQICDGDTVLIKTNKTTVEDGNVYAIDHGGDQRIKRIYREKNGVLLLVSDNAEAGGPPEVISRGDLADIDVIGLVWQRSGPVR